MFGPMKGHSAPVLCVAYTADGRFILSGSDDYTVRVWDAQTGELIAKPLSRHSDWVRSVACSLDGRFFASAGWDGKIYIYDLPYDARSDASAYRMWWKACLGVEGDGWVRDEDGTLLLWVPAAYRTRFREHARLVIDNGVATTVPHSADWGTF